MQRKISTATLAALSAGLLFLGATPAPAQGLVSAGHGTYLAANGQNTLEFTYALTESRNGDVGGFALWSGPNSIQLIWLESYVRLGEYVAAAGRVVAAVGTPPPAMGLGTTVFFAFKDNGPGAVDETASLSAVPPELGNPTMLEILAILGLPPGIPPPASYFRPLLTGNVWIR